MNIQQFNFVVDVLQSILWQYNDATNLLSLLNDKQAWLNENQTNFWFNENASNDANNNGWYQNVFNLLTANEFGLSVWSIILGIPSYIASNVLEPNSQIFGFNAFEIDGSLENNYSNFYDSNFSNVNSGIQITLEQQRFLLRLRYYQLITRGQVLSPQALESSSNTNPTPFDINAFLNYLCETSDIGYSGTIYVVDNLNMTMTYVFTSNTFPSGLLQAILANDVFPRPAGVYINQGVIISGYFLFLNQSNFTLLNGNPLSLL